ncbi:Gfo/Idh/MocA family protein [Paenibacillus hexagrammi]|uniref:Gfo/Idh/MocA family oxidoreductase n=1 Tax=Paenibacillus hexagrammi TaxID=2908839 RepID=A0ABY3SH07_9BACL|nr:Gfo/Idh/MocA family oxidoreductase [Paenibacillus sp. YPD9-1]UJF32481.1 Gfo/Idh/MocA family oxidoreductase [Paenibacillus sp. YPD9-1]
MTKPITFGIIGGAGFRAQYFYRIAQALPHLFRISGSVVRDEAKRTQMEQEWRVPAYPTLQDMLRAERPDYVVVSVSWTACYEYLFQLAELGIPALAETPPAPDLEGLKKLHTNLTSQGARIQVAEQYQFHPLQMARLALIQSGQLGEVSETTVSISHLYHAVSLIRTMLGIGFEDVSIKAMRFTSKWVAGPTRSGPPQEERIIPSKRDLAWLNFGDKLGIYDFTQDQHRSWTRSNHLSVRGERGEIFDTSVRSLADHATPIYMDLKRINRGEAENAEGYFLKGILAGERWVYENPFAPARLYDDEIAIATCLLKMGEYAAGGSSFYGLPEASQDHYLGMLMEEAIETGREVSSTPQPWAESL